MAYDKFSVYDFVLDESFKKWVNHPFSEEGIVWEKWLEENPDKMEVIQEARLLIVFMDFDTQHLSQERVHNLWQKLEERIDKKNGPLIPINLAPIRPSQTFIKKYSRWAAVFVGFLFINLSIFLILNHIDTSTYETNYGEQKTFLLPDGSMVILNANSTLKYKSGIFNKNLREVWLKGEAFFSVVPSNLKQKFIVHTSDLGVEVLGTEFNVKQREEGGTKVVLNSGKIILCLPAALKNEDSENTKEIIMKPGEMVEYYTKNKILTKNKVDTDKYLAWSKNKLVFDDTSLGEIIQLLEDNYGYKVILQKQKWKAKTFTATYPADQIEILLGALSKSFNLRICQSENLLYFEESDR